MPSGAPLPGPVSNIASWNYPMSVQVHAELVQVLAGNAVVAKTPTQGGFHCLTLAHAFMARAGLPVTLLSGIGGKLGDALISNPGIGALAFVGGRSNGRAAATSLADRRRRHFLEQEGLNAWGIWDFTEWELLAQHLRKGFEYAKQRCTAYPRYVVQRRLLPAFLDTYLPVVEGLRFGHPLAVERPDDPLPELDFGPVIGARKAAELGEQFDEALRGRGLPLHRGSLGAGRFLDGQDTSAYVAPACVLEPPAQLVAAPRRAVRPARLRRLRGHRGRAARGDERQQRLPGGQPGDRRHGLRVARRRAAAGLQGRHQQPRSRGDREEVFGGIGESWKGAFVGGDLLVQAVTYGPDGEDERLFGNFPDYSQFPTR